MEDILIKEPVILKPKQKAATPNADLEFANVAHLVANKWNENLWLTLLHTTPEEFKTKVDVFQTILSDKIQTKSTRPQTTVALQQIYAAIDYATVYIKIYIVEKYKKENLKSYYAAFGIKKDGRLPRGKNNRLAALQLTIDAIAANGFDAKEYGTTFWTDLKNQFEIQLNKASSTDSIVSNKVGEKNMLRKDLKIVLNAIIHAIKANYPNNFKEELRNWGFQKEKY
jgi:hypothetical protein